MRVYNMRNTLIKSEAILAYKLFLYYNLPVLPL